MRRSGLALSTAMALFWAAFLMMAAAIPAHAATWYAAPGANGSGTSAAEPGDLRTLVEDRSAAGDRVELASGTYIIARRIWARHQLTLHGAGMGKTILKAASGEDILAIYAEDATPANTAVRAMTFLNGAYYQLDILKGSPTVENVEFLGTVKNNSLIIRDGHPVIKKSRFKARSWEGLYACTPGAPLLVTGCLFSVPDGTGIRYLAVDSGSIEKCSFKGNATGIDISALETIYQTKNSAVLIQGNTFLGNSLGIGLSGGKNATDSSTIRGNTFQSNVLGIQANADPKGVEKSKIDSNRFLSNTRGLELDSTRAVVINNLFANSKEMNIRSQEGVNTIAFNTIAKAGAGGLVLVGIGFSFGDKSLVANNIFVSNAGYGVSVDSFSDKVRMGGNDWFGNAEGAVYGIYHDIGGNLAAAPKFKTGSYALAAGSPLINKAIAAFTTDHDITGAKRTKPDIGAYEYVTNR